MAAKNRKESLRASDHGKLRCVDVRRDPHDVLTIEFADCAAGEVERIPVRADAGLTPTPAVRPRRLGEPLVDLLTVDPNHVVEPSEDVQPDLRAVVYRAVCGFDHDVRRKKVAKRVEVTVKDGATPATEEEWPVGWWLVDCRCHALRLFHLQLTCVGERRNEVSLSLQAAHQGAPRLRCARCVAQLAINVRAVSGRYSPAIQ